MTSLRVFPYWFRLLSPLVQLPYESTIQISFNYECKQNLCMYRYRYSYTYIYMYVYICADEMRRHMGSRPSGTCILMGTYHAYWRSYWCWMLVQLSVVVGTSVFFLVYADFWERSRSRSQRWYRTYLLTKVSPSSIQSYVCICVFMQLISFCDSLSGYAIKVESETDKIIADFNSIENFSHWGKLLANSSKKFD